MVLQSNKVHLYYYLDQAGKVPETTEMLCLPSGEMVEPPSPTWGLDIQCGKGTDFSYGPWADRQRELLYKFFFPPDYHDMEATPDPRPGDVRQPAVFRIRLSTQNENSALDVLFSKNKETKAVHLNFGQGTNFEIKVPWVIGKSGYTTNISGTLMMLESTTSLDYR